MASSRSYLAFILDQLSGLEDVRHRPMMGEYLLYYREKLVGGIYDDRLMLKAIPELLHALPEPRLEAPYEGAKPMLLVENVDNRDSLEAMFKLLYGILPMSKPKKAKNKKIPSFESERRDFLFLIRRASAPSPA